MPPRTDLNPAPAAAGGVEPAGQGATLTDLLAGFRQAFRRIIGAPDYELYLARHRQLHPEVPPLNEKEFFRFALERRYSRGGPRCC